VSFLASFAESVILYMSIKQNCIALLWQISDKGTFFNFVGNIKFWFNIAKNQRNILAMCFNNQHAESVKV
jgi:hypothetical protein